MTAARRVADGDAAAVMPVRFDIAGTVIGSQTLVPGVEPITQHNRRSARAAAPLEPTQPQRPCDPVAGSRDGSVGVIPTRALFDLDARNRRDLFQPKDV